MSAGAHVAVAAEQNLEPAPAIASNAPELEHSKQQVRFAALVVLVMGLSLGQEIATVAHAVEPAKFQPEHMERA
jgi:hypothetical protein